MSKTDVRGEAVGETVTLLACPSEPVSSSDGVRDEPGRQSAVFDIQQLMAELEHVVRGKDISWRCHTY